MVQDTPRLTLPHGWEWGVPAVRFLNYDFGADGSGKPAPQTLINNWTVNKEQDWRQEAQQVRGRLTTSLRTLISGSDVRSRDESIKELVEELNDLEIVIQWRWTRNPASSKKHSRYNKKSFLK